MNFNIYKNKKILVTGHSGFKGSWLSLWLQMLGAEVSGYSLKPEELSHFNLLKLDQKSFFGDINDQKTLIAAIAEVKPDMIFHLAAQPLVRDSYTDPVDTYNTNVLGSLKVYQAALRNNVGAIVSVTTDKVYENKEWHWGYRENDRLGGHDPYSSSKACMEIMTDSFKKSFLSKGEMLIATARAGNVIGGGDWAKDRLVPDLVKNANASKATLIRNPKSLRPWQHVLDPLSGYLKLGEKLLENKKSFANSYNFGPEGSNFIIVDDVINVSKKIWNKIETKVDLDEHVHEANLLTLDSSRAIKELNWTPTLSTDEAILKTINWYKTYYEEGEVLSRNDLDFFVKKMVKA